MTSVINQNPYLRTTRNFPQEAQALAVEVNRSYLDIAEKVNDRVIGIYPTTRPSLTGEAWYITRDQKQQTFRQVYPFTFSANPTNIAHGINTANIAGFTHIYGTFTDGSIWYPLPYVDASAANNQISIQVTSSNIVITKGGGSPPAISSGFVVLEWLSNI